MGLRLNGRWLKLGSDKERILLASLALDVGRPVAISELMHRLWDGDLPDRARENAHTYVSRIRRLLKSAGTGPGAPSIEGRAHTYILRAARDSVDRQRFQRFVDAAFAADGGDARAVELLSRAEELWQGEALAGLPGDWAETVRTALAETRLSAGASRIAAGLRLGRFAEQIGELTVLVDRHPGDETLLGQLMLAYYGSGRYADALRVHQRARQSLMADYGALPGVELNAIHQGVLARVPARELAHGAGAGRPGAPPLVVTPAAPAPTGVPASTTVAAPEAPAPVAPTPDAVPPRNLPHQPTLVGRRSELRALSTMITDKGADRGSVVTVEAVSGMAGVGKTALVVATAHLLAGRYPDGQLYLDLRGHSPAQEPLTPRAALATLLRLLGAPAFSIPAELEGRTALWRTMLAERRVVIVLDDATGAEQIGPLLPSGSPSLTIVASRRHLTGIPQALSVPLDVLSKEDAITLFRGFAGEERTRDIAEIERIVRLCGYLPLAIELVAHRFRARTSWTLGVLAERLARSPGRLAEIRTADQEREMTRAFALSYRTLTAQQRTAFRRLGLHSGPDFTADAAAALLGLPADTTERLLEGLLACHLLREPVPDRYRFHDLLREYAYGLSQADDSEQERRQAVARLTDFYITTADRADRAAYPRRVRPGPPAPPTPGPAFADTAAARTWLAAERGNLLAVEEQTRRDGAPERAARLACTLAGFLQAECYWQGAKKLLLHAVAHWEGAGDEPALCSALIDLCAADASIGSYAEAAEAGERALELARALRDEPAEAEALRVLGTLNWHLGENRKALVLLQKSLAIRSISGDVWDRARSRNNVAVTLLFLGERGRALDHFRNALANFREAGDVTASAQTLNNIGRLQIRSGELEAARRSFEESMALLENSGSRYDRATVRRNLAEVLVESGESAAALVIFGETLSEFRALGDRKSQAENLIGIGEARWQLGDPEASVRDHREGLRIAQDIGAARYEVQALRGLGRAAFVEGRPAEATDLLRTAVAVAARTDDLDEETAARMLLAEVRLAAGDIDEARMTLRQAFESVRHRDNVDARRVARRLDEVERMAGGGAGESSVSRDQ
ncbi:tetratricopeptide repeat protein [Streptomyces sp. NPDC006645]|uniref:AfsR/SARP family transcriptional regulator n=1 Tax=unclassified Streptomyces TaxID=2593676 RepID=UPI0033A292A6